MRALVRILLAMLLFAAPAAQAIALSRWDLPSPTEEWMNTGLKVTASFMAACAT